MCELVYMYLNNSLKIVRIAGEIYTLIRYILFRRYLFDRNYKGENVAFSRFGGRMTFQSSDLTSQDDDGRRLQLVIIVLNSPHII